MSGHSLAAPLTEQELDKWVQSGSLDAWYEIMWRPYWVIIILISVLIYQGSQLSSQDGLEPRRFIDVTEKTGTGLDIK